jgi:hypothetical protein
MQMPNDDSKNINNKQVPHTTMLMGPITPLMTIKYSISKASTKPMAHANRF